MRTDVNAIRPGPLQQAQLFLDRWYIVAHARGLWIEPRQSRVSLDDACALMSRLSRVMQNGMIRRVILRINGDSVAKHHWPVLIRLSAELANRSSSNFRVVYTSLMPPPGVIEPDLGLTRPNTQPNSIILFIRGENNN